MYLSCSAYYITKLPALATGYSRYILQDQLKPQLSAKVYSGVYTGLYWTLLILHGCPSGEIFQSCGWHMYDVISWDGFMLQLNPTMSSISLLLPKMEAELRPRCK